MEIKKFEAYELEDEHYDDFAEEHAKVLISKFIDEELNGLTMEDALEWVATQYDLDEDTKYIVAQATKIYVEGLFDKVKTL